jgi:hypothetical protein
MSRWAAPNDVAVVHQATTEFEAISVREMLEAAGLRAVVRSRLVPGYNVPTLAGGQGGIVADILVPPEQEAQARALVAEYLAALEEGGEPPNAVPPDAVPPDAVPPDAAPPDAVEIREMPQAVESRESEERPSS